MVAATLLLLAGSVACSGNPETRKQRSFETANQYVQQHKLREAVIEYRNAIQIDASFGEARKKLAEAFAKAGDQNGALEQYVRAADLLPKDVDVQLAAGVYLLYGRFTGRDEATGEVRNERP